MQWAVTARRDPKSTARFARLGYAIPISRTAKGPGPFEPFRVRLADNGSDDELEMNDCDALAAKGPGPFELFRVRVADTRYSEADADVAATA